MRSTWHRYLPTFMTKSARLTGSAKLPCRLQGAAPVLLPLATSQDIYWSGEISCVWGHSRSLPRTQIYTDTLHLPTVLFAVPIKPTPLRAGCSLTSPDCFLPTSINKSVPPWVPSGFSAKRVLPSLHTGLGCSDGAKHSSVLGNMLNNAHWKLSCVHSIFHKACSVNCRVVWVQSAIRQRLVKISMDASQRGRSALTLNINNLLQRQRLEAYDCTREHGQKCVSVKQAKMHSVCLQNYGNF